jgi:regulator of protease activity HflC (stomatin/prohibitin superfamily)
VEETGQELSFFNRFSSGVMGCEKDKHNGRSKLLTTIMNIMSYMGLTVISIGAIWLPAIMNRPSWIVAEGFCGLLYRHGKLLHRISPGEHRFWRGGYSVRFVDMRPTMLEMTMENLPSSNLASTKISVELTYQIIHAETVVQQAPDCAGYLEQSIRNATRSALSEVSNDARNDKRHDFEQQIFEQVKGDADTIGILVHQLQIKELLFQKQIKTELFQQVA